MSNIDTINNPLASNSVKISEMRLDYLRVKTKDKLLLLDLDGFLGQYNTNLKSHQRITFRPYFDIFVREMSDHCDIFLYLFLNL